jgi:hypothetical protein
MQTWHFKTRIEPMQRQGVPRHRVTERKVAREDTKGVVHKRSRNLYERHSGGAHGKRATKRAMMLGRAGTTPTAAGRDVVGSGVGSEGHRRTTPASAHDSRGNDSEMGRTGATLAERAPSVNGRFRRAHQEDVSLVGVSTCVQQPQTERMSDTAGHTYTRVS